MKPKLKKFTEFAQNVLPHEASYLLKVQNFEDPEKLSILKLIAENSSDSTKALPFDPSIDKRKYSNIKKWILAKLEAIDVDIDFEWINEINRKVVTDAITPKEERELLRKISNYEHPVYNFMKFYELALNFRHFLLIRLSYDSHKAVNEFVKKYKAAYEEARDINERLHQATEDIIDHYASNRTESNCWEDWLKSVFYNQELDGNSRFLAVIRLTFMYFNYREFDKLKAVYDDLDEMLKGGKFYTRRILFNYYANRLMLHSKFDVSQQAEEYGYLSIRQKNSDHLQYLNNFSSILLRQGKIDEALNLMRESMTEMRSSNNFHSKIGFVAFYMKCLNLNGQPSDSEAFAESFLRMNKDHVLHKRWYIFFTAYLRSLMLQQKYEKVITVCKRYQLLQRDEADKRKLTYLPTVKWYYDVSRYMEGRMSDESLIESMNSTVDSFSNNRHKSAIVKDLFKDLKNHIPHLIDKIKSQIFFEAPSN
ncbi:hypothetical protein GCM10009122_25650 [Fulvivirga kasyanovii]|uniref:Tetratricopeptide repeat protein n=1 Tax=Fulvivirga kasyanovii TaxID=396812 RepID=A0ABW9RQP9_9BACT|nr:hypothetical protein [Fulvivirga kasyanovii]MTI26067.1 hypothetical protein [Fulvivirga kasyanovii]